METLDELLRKAEAAHGHQRAGKILGLRMALLGLERLHKGLTGLAGNQSARVAP